MDSKSLFASKTFWVNVVVPAALAALKGFGYEVSSEDVLYLLGVVNVILRVMSSRPVHIVSPSA